MVDEHLVWPEQLHELHEPSISTWPDLPGIRPLPAVTGVVWPDLIASARGHQSSCGGSGSFSAREQRWPTAAAEQPCPSDEAAMTTRSSWDTAIASTWYLPKLSSSEEVAVLDIAPARGSPDAKDLQGQHQRTRVLEVSSV